MAFDTRNADYVGWLGYESRDVLLPCPYCGERSLDPVEHAQVVHGASYEQTLLALTKACHG